MVPLSFLIARPQMSTMDPVKLWPSFRGMTPRKKVSSSGSFIRPTHTRKSTTMKVIAMATTPAIQMTMTVSAQRIARMSWKKFQTPRPNSLKEFLIFASITASLVIKLVIKNEQRALQLSTIQHRKLMSIPTDTTEVNRETKSATRWPRF